MVFFHGPVASRDHAANGTVPPREELSLTRPFPRLHVTSAWTSSAFKSRFFSLDAGFFFVIVLPTFKGLLVQEPESQKKKPVKK